MFVPYRFADNWRQEELSDVTVQITAPDSTTLTQLPGHGIILSQSPFFKAQVSHDYFQHQQSPLDSNRALAVALLLSVSPMC
jgi:hypothetical protein